MLLHLGRFTYHWNKVRKAHGLQGFSVYAQHSRNGQPATKSAAENLGRSLVAEPNGMYENTLPHKLAIEDHLRALDLQVSSPRAAEVLAEVDVLLHKRASARHALC